MVIWMRYTNIMSDKSPDLPTPKQAVVTAERILDNTKKNPPAKSVQEKLEEEEFRFHAPGKDSSVTEEAEAYLKKTRETHERTQAVGKSGKSTKWSETKHIPNIEECVIQFFKFLILQEVVKIKLLYDENARVIASREKEISKWRQPKEVTIPTEDGKVVFTTDFVKGQGSRLHVTQFTFVTSGFGEDSEEITSDVVITSSELSISLRDLETGDYDVHRIFGDGSKPNKVDEDTPKALQKAEALIKLYTGPI